MCEDTEVISAYVKRATDEWSSMSHYGLKKKQDSFGFFLFFLKTHRQL